VRNRKEKDRQVIYCNKDSICISSKKKKVRIRTL